VNRTYPVIAILALGVALAVAGCGGSSSSSSSGEAGYGSGEESTAASKPASSEPSGTAATIAVGNVGGDVGNVLVDSEGMTLYYFEKDKKGGKSTCYGACASGWPPLATSGAPKGMSDVEASKLGTTKRSDGTMQVTYAGWPLYTFVEDKKPGEDNGTDSKAFGASWYPLHPNGEKAGS
jgi:predicted lipoprotein with Yx(FWY)xxD motif